MPVIANAAEQRSAEGALLSTRLVIIRAADRRRYERELVDARAIATKSLASERETAELREQFIAVLGHDLRNPLAASMREPGSFSALGVCRTTKSFASST
jgi:sigma-B regulation protein RsbU (phosphoserine phosphatase)